MYINDIQLAITLALGIFSLLVYFYIPIILPILTQFCEVTLTHIKFLEKVSQLLLLNNLAIIYTR